MTRAYTKEENPEMEKILDFKKMSQKELEKIYPEVKYTQVVTSGDFSLNEKTKSIQFTEQGIEKMEHNSIAWCNPSLNLLPSITLPVNSSTIFTCPSLTT